MSLKVFMQFLKRYPNPSIENKIFWKASIPYYHVKTLAVLSITLSSAPWRAYVLSGDTHDYLTIYARIAGNTIKIIKSAVK